MTSPQHDPVERSIAVPEARSKPRKIAEDSHSTNLDAPEPTPLLESSFKENPEETPTSKRSGPNTRRELFAEPLSFRNLAVALKIAFSAFPRKKDQDALRLSFVLYTLRIRTVPESTLGRLGMTTMKDYRIWRDEKGEAIAFSGNWKLSPTPDALWIGWIGVKPSARGGVGTNIIHHIEAEARTAGDKRLMLFHNAANEKLDRLYTRLGFEFVEKNSAWGEEVTVRSKSLC